MCQTPKHGNVESPAVHAGGFSLIEVITVMAIMMIVLAVTVSTDRKSQSAVKQLNATYEVALFIREAQVRGTSVITTGTVFDYAVGVHIAAGSPSSLLMFVDSSKDGKYQTGETVLQTFTLKDGMTVSGCAGTIAAPGGSCGVVNIVFKRPHPDALIYYAAEGSTRAAAQVTVTGSGISRNILVYNTGLISVQ